ncbi:hypothetical protein FB451DRAFT_1170407 [Mycena latifolia]|nr:hypothetical protein FB451DRAFT_1170407 [Mycena latifolia]
MSYARDPEQNYALLPWDILAASGLRDVERRLLNFSTMNFACELLTLLEPFDSGLVRIAFHNERIEGHVPLERLLLPLEPADEGIFWPRGWSVIYGSRYIAGATEMNTTRTRLRVEPVLEMETNLLIYYGCSENFMSTHNLYTFGPMLQI